MVEVYNLNSLKSELSHNARPYQFEHQNKIIFSHTELSYKYLNFNKNHIEIANIQLCS